MTDIQHGTPGGYLAGCKTAAMCPAVISCRTVYTRHRGDLTFRRMYDAGTTLADIVAADEAAAVADVVAEKEARRAERVKTHAPKSRSAAASRREQTRIRWTEDDDRQLLECVAADMSVSASARAMRKSTSTLRDHAALLGVEFRDGRAGRVIKPRTPGGSSGRVRRPWTDVDDQAIIAGAAANLSVIDVARQIDRDRQTVWTHALQLGVTLQRPARSIRAVGEKGPRKDSRPTYTRRGREARTLRPHGTNAAFSRGCRTVEGCPNFGTDQPTCVEAHRQYHRDYVADRKAAGVPAENHGTAYGYQLGCKAGSDCPASPTCAEASLAAETERARAAGRPEAEALVDAGPVREHVRSLLTSMTLEQVAEAASVHRSQLGNLIYGRSGERGRSGAPMQRVTASRAQRIMAVKR